MESAYRDQFERGFALYRASRLRKLRKGHFKLAFSKLFELLAIGLKIGIKSRAKLVWGQDMTVVYPETTSLAISRYGFYEEGLTNMILEHLKPGMTFFDVGAHFGYYTLLAAWIVGDEGEIHSFEPTPSTFEVLKSNAGQKHNVHLNRVAVSSKPGTVTFNDYGTRFTAYNSMFQARMDEADLKRFKPSNFEVQATSLDEYVAQKGLTPDFVKIDAESAEHEILRGMSGVLDRFRPIVSVEVGDMDIEGVPGCKELISYLSGKGYQPYEFGQSGIVRHQAQDRYEYDNILFLPES